MNDNMQSAQNWQSTVINVPFDDMAEAIALQLSNPTFITRPASQYPQVCF